MISATLLHTLTREERANQRNAVLAGFLGWTLDAFDFFILVFVLVPVAHGFHKLVLDIALALTASLAFRQCWAAEQSCREMNEFSFHFHRDFICGAWNPFRLLKCSATLHAFGCARFPLRKGQTRSFGVGA